MECLHAMRTLAMVLLEDPDYPVDVWSSFYRAVNEGLALCGCPGGSWYCRSRCGMSGSRSSGSR